MPEYRIYKLDRGGHIGEPSRDITQATDEEAIAATQQLLDGHDLEVWEGSRLIIKLESKDKK